MSKNNINTMAAESFCNLIRSLNLEPGSNATVFNLNGSTDDFSVGQPNSIEISSSRNFMDKINAFAPNYGKTVFEKIDIAVILQENLPKSSICDNNVENGNNFKPLGIKIK